MKLLVLGYPNTQASHNYPSQRFSSQCSDLLWPNGTKVRFSHSFNILISEHHYFFSSFSLSLFLGVGGVYAWGRWKLLGQGSNPCHSSNLSCCSDNARSLTSCTTREFFFLSFLFIFVFESQLFLLSTAIVLYRSMVVNHQSCYNLSPYFHLSLRGISTQYPKWLWIR